MTPDTMIDRMAELRAASNPILPDRQPSSGRNSRAASGFHSRDASPRITPRLNSPRSPSFRTSSPGSIARDKALQDFLVKLENIRLGPLHELESVLSEAKAVHSQALSATNPRVETEALRRAEMCAEHASTTASRTYKELQAIAGDIDAPNLAVGEQSLRKQAFSGVSVLLQNAINSYFESQQAFRTKMEAKASRQLRAAFPDANDVAVAAVASSQCTAASAIQQSLQIHPGAGPLRASTVVHVAQGRSNELANLSHAARELKQAFLDVQSLVDTQGTAVDDISRHVAETRERTSNARRQLEAMEASRRSACRCYCWLAVVAVLIGAMMFLFVILHHNGII